MRFSIILPTYNSSGTIAETLNSILEQLTNMDELIIIDDGSTDNTQSVVDPYLCSNIRYFWRENSGGPASPRNLGIEKARGKYIQLFDSDDLMLPGKLESTFSAFEGNPDAGLVFTNFRTIDEQGAVIKSSFLDDYELVKKNKFIGKSDGFRINAPQGCMYLARENYIGTSGVAVPASVFRQVGVFDSSLRNGDDRDMWFRITRKYPIVYLPNEYHCYRLRSNSISMGSAEKRSGSKIKVLERQLQCPINEKFASDIRHLLSENYHSLAYEAFNQGRMREARSYIHNAMSYEKSRRHLTLYCKTLLGKNFVEELRRFKRKIND